MRKVLVLPVLLVALLAGCAGASKGLVVSGESLVAIGDQFVAVAHVYKDGCDTPPQRIPPADCARFRAFGVKFKVAYPAAHKVWEAARRTNDVAAQKNASLLISALAVELSTLTVDVINRVGGN